MSENEDEMKIPEYMMFGLFSFILIPLTLPMLILYLLGRFWVWVGLYDLYDRWLNG